MPKAPIEGEPSRKKKLSVLRHQNQFSNTKGEKWGRIPLRKTTHFLTSIFIKINPVASHPRHRALFELKSVLSFYVQFWHSEANLNIPKISWYSQSPNILHKIGTFQNTVNFLGKILILLGFEFALCFFGFEMVAHGRFLQGIDVLHTVIESLRIIAGAGADKTETSR